MASLQFSPKSLGRKVASACAIGFAMARSWRITPGNFAAYTAISNLWNVIGKLLVGSALVAGAVVAGLQLPPSMRNAVIFGSGGVLLVALLVIAAGVLLYRTFTFLLEIPVGGASAIVWLLYRTQLAPRIEAKA